MIVYSIGSDRNVFDKNSYSFKRMSLYSQKVVEFNIIVLSLQRHNLKPISTSNLKIYPTNSISKIFYPIDIVKIFFRLYKKSKEEVLTSQDPFEVGLISLFLAKIFNIPIQIQVHTDMFSNNFRNSLIGKFRFFISKIVIGNCSRVRVVSDKLKSNLENIFKIKTPIDVLSIQVNKEEINNIKPIDFKKSLNVSKVVLVVSRLSVEKKVDCVLYSFKNLISRLESVNLVILGDGDQKEKLQNIAEDLGIKNKVLFLGWRNEKEVFEYMKSSDLFISLSDFEGYGMSLVEAAICKCPIISTKTGIVYELLKDKEGCLFVSNSDILDISDNMYNVLTDPNLAKKLSDNAFSVFDKKYSTEKYIESYVKLLKLCIS